MLCLRPEQSKDVTIKCCPKKVNNKVYCSISAASEHRYTSGLVFEGIPFEEVVVLKKVTWCLAEA